MATAALAPGELPKSITRDRRHKNQRLSELPAVGRTARLGNADATLRRDIDWRDAFWVASGVPALVLFSIGGIAATVGTPSYVVWTVSVVFGFIQAFTYAEIAGLFPGKSGGASVYGATAWVRYGKLLAPLSVWCNWLAWSPVLAIGCGIAAGYVLTSLFAADAAVAHLGDHACSISAP